MKILITTDWYRPVINGVVTSVLNLRDGLLRTGHEVRILTLSPTHHSHREDGVYYIGSVSVGMIYPNARLKLPARERLLQELIDWKPDVVHSQCEFSTFRLAKRIAGACHAPLIHTYHTIYEDYTHYFSPNRAMGKKMTELFSRRILQNTEAVIAPSGKVSDMLKRYLVQKPIRIVPTGIDLSRYEREPGVREETRRMLGIGREECILVYVGRLAKEKNIEELFSLLSTKPLKNLRLLLVGDGPYRSELEELAGELRIADRLLFTGMVDPKEVSRYYQAGDIFVSASNSETQGLTYMEAMACGLCVVCRKDACLQDVVRQGQNGFLYETEKEFAELIVGLQADAVKRDFVGERARAEMYRRFSKEAFVENVVGVYEQCIRSRNVRMEERDGKGHAAKREKCHRADRFGIDSRRAGLRIS